MMFNLRPFLAAKKARYHHISREHLRALDKLFEQLNRGPASKLKDGFTYAKLVLLSSFTRFEVHLSALVILLLALNTSMFLPLGSTDILSRLFVVLVSMLLGTSISFLLMFLLLPFHIWRGISLWAISAFHPVLSAFVFATTLPHLLGSFQNEIVPSFSDLFGPVLLLYGLTNAFVLWQTKKHICFRSFQRQHRIEHVTAILPAEKRGAVLLMSAADHYVEFFTERGSHLHRMTMNAAIEKANPDEGMRVHRSHWVSYSAMQMLEKVGERHFLILRDGQRVPVSPRNVPKVRTALDASPRIAAE